MVSFIKVFFGKNFMFKNKLSLFLLCMTLPWCTAYSAALNELSKHSGVNVKRLEQAISLAQFQPKIIETMTRPYESKQWWEYRNLFITKSRVNAGVDFYFKHEDTLKNAEAKTGVPPEIVCAIIGVETFYGKNMGNWSVLDALYTLGFKYPPREKYFSKEFANFVALADRENWDLKSVLGSYAGAMGMGQFMPSSYLSYAVDFDNDGKINLFNDIEDAIGSVANYFKAHGWDQGHGIFYPALAKKDPTTLMKKEWNLTAGEMYENGISTKVNIPADEKVRLFKFELKDNKLGFGVGLHNFNVIMKYNKSPLYARAVYELSVFIRAEHDKRLLERGIKVKPHSRIP